MDARVRDRLLAKHLMGVAPAMDEYGRWWIRNRSESGILWGQARLMPRYSTTWEGMGLVVAAMRARGYPFQLSKGQGERWYCLFVADSQYAGVADTAPFAVALAALRALGVEVPAE